MLDRTDFLLLHSAARRADADAIDRLSMEIAEHHGLIDGSNRRRFAQIDALVHHVYPEGPAHAVVAAAVWHNWLFFFEEARDAGRCGRDAAAIRASVGRYVAVLRGTGAADRDDPLSTYAQTFRRLARQRMSEGWMQRFCASVEGYLLSHDEGAVPDVDAYLDRCDRGGAVRIALDLIELVHGEELPDAALGDPAFHELRRACARAVACFDDIVAYPAEDNPNNLVQVLAAQRDLSYEDAVQAAVDVTNDAAWDVPIFEMQLVGRHPEAIVAAYARGVRAWQRGNVERSLHERRYVSPDSPFTQLRAA